MVNTIPYTRWHELVTGIYTTTTCTQDIAQLLMIQRHLPRLKISEVKISGGYWMAYVRPRSPLSGELKKGWYRVKDLINEVGC